jgi:hypothetical protein
VNGSIVREGDTVSGALITKVSVDRVSYIRAGKTHEATLPHTRIDVRVNPSLQAGQP